MSESYLKDKVVMITGASSGIGEASARAFAAEGARLVLCARRYDRLVELVPALEAAGSPDVLIFQADVRDRGEVDRFVGAAQTHFGRIDILVNNAGLARGMERLDDDDPAAWEAWDEMIDTNIRALLAVTQRVLPVMEAQSSGHVINLTSLASHSVYEGGGVYCATKHAALAISQTLRLEVVERGIRVTAISPGLVETEFSVVRFRGRQDRADNVYAGLTPLTAQDIADCILFAAGRPPHMNIDEIRITPQAQAAAHKVVRRPQAQ
jgi:3-hydroxy acid dehydrogenase/malonic semialdehyde reductase